MTLCSYSNPDHCNKVLHLHTGSILDKKKTLWQFCMTDPNPSPLSIAQLTAINTWFVLHSTGTESLRRKDGLLERE